MQIHYNGDDGSALIFVEYKTAYVVLFMDKQFVRWYCSVIEFEGVIVDCSYLI